MPTYAAMDGTNEIVYIVTTTANPLANFIDIDVALQTYPNLSPGWTTPDGGNTWVAPLPTSTLGNRTALMGKGASALLNNESYLDIATPTQAQALAQINALTLQMDAVIRLLINQLSSTAGT